ncbi:hypothetical protein ACNOYE_34015 [Nannocystaceae bacterium ST9]
MRASAIAWLAALLVVGLPGPAASAAPPSDVVAEPAAEPKQRALAEALQVEPGASCLDHATLLQHLQSWRSEPTLDDRIAVLVHAGDDPRSIGFEVWVGTSPWIERSFDPAPEDCADRHAVVALAIAIALDDTLAEELGLIAGPSEPSETPEPTAVIQVTDDELPQDEPEPELPSRRPGLGLTLAAGMFGGMHPQLGAGGLLSFDVRPLPHFDLRFGGFASHVPGVRFSEGTIASTVAAGRFDMCWGTLPRTVRLRICGGIAAGALHAAPRGFDRNLPQTLPWIAALGGIDLVVRLVGPLALELRIDGFVALQRNVLDLSTVNGETVGSLPYGAGGLILAVGPRFEF